MHREEDEAGAECVTGFPVKEKAEELARVRRKAEATVLILIVCSYFLFMVM